jgi:hypothetical protein
MIKWLVIEAGLGEVPLAPLERRVGLALVKASWLMEQRSGEPETAPEVP